MIQTNTYIKALILMLLIHTISYTQITVTPNNWTVDLNGEITEAGNDFVGNYTSASNQMQINLSGFNTTILILLITEPWLVSARFAPNPNWDNDTILETRRTGNGNTTSTLCTAALCNITGGNNYITLTQTDQLFFNGQANRNQIPIQFRLSNISVTNIQAINSTPYYRANIIFTVTAN